MKPYLLLIKTKEYDPLEHPDDYEYRLYVGAYGRSLVTTLGKYALSFDTNDLLDTSLCNFLDDNEYGFYPVRSSTVPGVHVEFKRNYYYL